MVLSGNTLYGTASTEGSSGNGTVFRVNTDGTSFTNLHSFTFSDGASPAALILSDNTLYGTAAYGGSFGGGTVFALNTDGTGFTNLHSFTAGSTNSDGASPRAGLTLSGNTLYGTAFGGSSFGAGTVFAINTNGTGCTNLHSFTRGVDGANPYAGLILSGNTLFGTAEYGGSAGNGTVFAVNTDGTGFTNLYSFTATSGPYPPTNSDGACPTASLILSGNTLYGTAYAGGSSGNGTIFSIFIPPKLTISPSGQSVILMWPTNYTDFTLQFTTNLGSPVWTTNLPSPVVVNGQYTVTNPISGTKQFFRLSQ